MAQSCHDCAFTALCSCQASGAACSHTPVPETKNIHKQLGKGNNYRETSGKFGVVASTAYEKVSTMGTDENLLRLVPVPGHGARVLPLRLVRTERGLCSDWSSCPGTKHRHQV